MKLNIIFSFLLIFLTYRTNAQRSSALAPETVNYKPGKGMPQFPGGLYAFLAYVEQHINWSGDLYGSFLTPEKLRFSFVVDAAGRVTAINVLKHPGFGTREELIRVLRNSPKWKPALINNKKVNVRYVLEVQVPPPTVDSLPPGTNVSAKSASDIRIDEPKSKLNRVDVEPEFPGGRDAFLSYVRNNYHCTHYVYSQISKNGESPTIEVSFIIDTDGCVVDTKILTDPGFGAGEELSRVLQHSPKWKPGMHNKRPVRVQYNMPLKIYPPDLSTIPSDTAQVLFLLPFNNRIRRDVKLPIVHFSKERYVFSERVSACNSDKLTFEFEKRALSDRYTILEQVKACMPADTLRKLQGRVAMQLLVDTSGTSCLTSYSHTVNVPYKALPLAEALTEKIKWTVLPDKSGKKEHVNVLIVFTFTDDKIVYQHVSFNPGSSALNEIEIAEVAKTGRY